MPKKRINQPAPSGRAALRLAKNPIRSSRAVAKSAPRGLSIRSKVLAAFVLVTLLIATTAILAQHGKQKRTAEKNPTGRVHDASLSTQSNGPQSGEMSPDSLTSPSLWSKEYIHGPGGRVIATEERNTFTDVAEGSPFYDDIYRIAARGVTVGCSTNPPMYCPDQNVTREQMAAFLIRALGEFSPPTPQTQRFNDVQPPDCAQPCSPNSFYNFIDRMAVRQITVGCSASPPLYCPGSQVLHEQMAAFVMRARGEPNPPPPTQQRFNDVPISGPNANPFAALIERMGALDIWQGQGCPGTNNYCPTAPVTRRQMAHILVRAFGI